jgi:hypothetical protein
MNTDRLTTIISTYLFLKYISESQKRYQYLYRHFLLLWLAKDQISFALCKFFTDSIARKHSPMKAKSEGSLDYLTKAGF